MIFPVILSGGCGSRLWPLSDTSKPKQFLSFPSGSSSFFQKTVKRLSGKNYQAPIVVSGVSYQSLINQHLSEIEVETSAIILEPVARNTAPAIIASALYAYSKDPDAIICVLSSDHYIDDDRAFNQVIVKALESARLGNLVSLGISPTHPDTGYGYIKKGERISSHSFKVDSFKEKPKEKAAIQYLESSDYYWNSGIFVFPVKSFLQEAKRLKPEMVEKCNMALIKANVQDGAIHLDINSFSEIESLSIDYAIMEHTKKAVVVPASFGWNDIGSYKGLWQALEKDQNLNAMDGNVILEQTKNCLVHTDGLPVALLGVENIAVVSTSSLLLITSLEKAADIKAFSAMVNDKFKPLEPLKKKVCLTIPCMGAGGAERVMAILANAWVAKGISVSLISYESRDKDPFYKLDERISYYPLDLLSETKSFSQKVRGFLKRVLLLRKQIKSINPDVVLSFTNTQNVETLLATLGLNSKVFVSERVNPYHMPLNVFYRVLRRLLYPLAQKIIVQTQDVRNFFSKTLQEKIVVLPNPVAVPKKNRKNDNKDRKKIISVGRLEHQKGFDLLIQVFAKLSGDFPDWDLCIWGEGKERSVLENLIKSHSLESRIYLPGLYQDIGDAFQQGDIFVCSSRYEGFPNALCEAMAHGLPVISFDCPSGPSEIIKNETDGILIEPENLSYLSQALNRLMSDKNLRNDLAKNAKQITVRFGEKLIVEKWSHVVGRG
jgi:mannose-1-phosphate guanylyltransferase/mannose-6-phosphate isomerase